MFSGPVIFFIVCLGISTDTIKVFPATDSLKINEIQMLGSHNSYRKKTHQPLWDELHRWKHPFSKAFVVQPWNYTHQPLDSQLSVYGMRSLEIDLYHDPTGGRFYSRKGNEKMDEKTESGIDDLKKPGMKVMHVPDYDYETHHYLFTDALQTIKNWSDKNPEHEPLFVAVELKELQFMKYFFPRSCTKVLEFSKNAVDSVEMEIESVFGKNSDKIFTPDELRDSSETLNASILKNGWPTLGECRGKIFFILMAKDEAKENYLEGHPSLRGRNMFVFSSEGNPETAFIKMDNPKKKKKEIRELVKKGYIVRTRTDANSKDARKNSYKRYRKALESGAQILSTDYYAGDKCFLDGDSCSDFRINLPEGAIFRINPIRTEKN